MRDISPEISGTTEGITSVQKGLKNFDIDHFLYALKTGVWNEQKVEALTLHLQSTRPKFQKEYEKLAKFANNFVLTYALKNNNCYSLAMQGLRQMRSFFAEIKRIFRKFIPKERKSKFITHILLKPKSLYHYSKLCSDTYTKDFYQFECYPPCVSALYNEMEALFILFYRSLQVCKDVIRTVDETRKNCNICDEYLANQEKAIWDEISDIITYFTFDKLQEDISQHPNLRDFLNCQDMEKRASKFYHVLTSAELKLFVIIKKNEPTKQI